MKYEDFINAVGPGWQPMVAELIKDLEAIGWDGELHQVKEKFGELRFYVGSGTRMMFDLIEAAEKKSGTICEVCGKAADGPRVNQNGWFKTLCDPCRGEHGYG